MSISYDPNIPSPNNNPSDDVTTMQTNANAINTIMGRDLYTFSSPFAGQHQFIRLPGNVTPSAPTGLEGAIYTVPGTAQPAKSQLVFRNSSYAMPLSPIKAFCLFSGTTIFNQSNITSVTNPAVGQYTITLTNALPSTAYAVIATPALGGFAELSISYTITSTTVFRIFVYNSKGTAAGVNPAAVSCMVLQV